MIIHGNGSHRINAEGSTKLLPPGKPPTQIINGWEVYSTEPPITRYASAADYIAKVEKAAKRYPKRKESAYANDRLLSYGSYLYWMWIEEEWFKEYPFSSCVEKGVASLANLRRKQCRPLSTAEAHLFNLFGEAGTDRVSS